jgi:hypothetical protein
VFTRYLPYPVYDMYQAVHNIIYIYATRHPLYPLNLALISLTSGGRSVDMFARGLRPRIQFRSVHIEVICMHIFNLSLYLNDGFLDTP